MRDVYKQVNITELHKERNSPRREDALVLMPIAPRISSYGLVLNTFRGKGRRMFTLGRYFS